MKLKDMTIEQLCEYCEKHTCSRCMFKMANEYGDCFFDKPLKDWSISDAYVEVLEK